MPGDGQREDVDNDPAYLKHFPKPSNVVKDTHLGVLLGRLVTRNSFYIRYSILPNHSFLHLHG
jgi:hypothetical protein